MRTGLCLCSPATSSRIGNTANLRWLLAPLPTTKALREFQFRRGGTRALRPGHHGLRAWMVPKNSPHPVHVLASGGEVHIRCGACRCRTQTMLTATSIYITYKTVPLGGWCEIYYNERKMNTSGRFPTVQPVCTGCT